MTKLYFKALYHTLVIGLIAILSLLLYLVIEDLDSIHRTLNFHRMVIYELVEEELGGIRGGGDCGSV